MTVRVFQFWSGTPASIREVSVPTSVIESVNNIEQDRDSRVLDLLNQIFFYGQNEEQAQPAPSVSVGDIIELTVDGLIEFWVVGNCGFENYGMEKHFIFSATALANRGTKIQ